MSYFLGPNWWHHHGIKLRPKLASGKPYGIYFEHENGKKTVASIWIYDVRNLPLGYKKGEEPKFLLHYYIKHSQYEEVEGKYIFSERELKRAFWLITDFSEVPATSRMNWQELDRLGGDDAFPGLFIRRGHYVNFPNAGSGRDGDANISLEIDESIQKRVFDLIEEAKRWRKEIEASPDESGLPY